MPSSMSKSVLLPNSLVSPPEYGMAHDSFRSPKQSPAQLPSIRELSLGAVHKSTMGYQNANDNNNHNHNGQVIKPSMSNMSIFLSPPPSPLDKFSHSAPVTSSIIDPPLYDRERSSSVAEHSPLFGPVDRMDVEPKETTVVVPQAAVTATTTVVVPATPPPAPIEPAYQPVGHSARKSIAKPTQEEYAIFVSTVFQLYSRNPREWLRKERGYLADRSNALKAQAERERARNARAMSLSGSSSNAMSPPSPGFRGQANGYGNINNGARPVPRLSRLAPRARNGSVGAGLASPALKSPRVNSNGGVAKLGSSSPKAPKPFVSSREDVDYKSIPDMCPPIESLPNNPRCLKADWKGGPLDLSQDPDRHLLHPAELHLASTLRLSCAQYLTSKRRIFQDRIARAKRGYEFRKTDSQKACRIDVNKASKLWSAFERVGWFDQKWLQPYL